MKKVTTVFTIEITFIGETEEVRALTPEEKVAVEQVIKHNLNADCVLIIKEQEFEGEELPKTP